VGGGFTACLVPSEGSTDGRCVATGVSVLDVFLLSCPSWTDPEGDSLLQYRFGYYVAGNSSNGTASAVWFDWAGESTKSLSLPSGTVVAMAQVKDDCGGHTDVLQAVLVVSDGQGGGGGRRLLAAANFWDIAKAKVKSALQTFRPDNVNQLMSSMAAEMARLSRSGVDAAGLRESMMLNLRTAADQVILDTIKKSSK
jgi:hypothetical protein